MKRRTFLSGGGAALFAPPGQPARGTANASIDFRYAPADQQVAFCFPDDHYKSLAGREGDLRYGYDRTRKVNHFQQTVRFSLVGADRTPEITQQLESTGVPIIHTRVIRTRAVLELIAFATNHAGEGRVDNVLAVVTPRTRAPLRAAISVAVKTRRRGFSRNTGGITVFSLDSESAAPFMVANCPLRMSDTGDGYGLVAIDGVTAPDAPLRAFFRFPQEGQDVARLREGLGDPDALLADARRFWKQWSPFHSGVSMRLPSVYNDFLIASARNILQAREEVDHKLTFQVGPTAYRGLWVVDGNFILETARYLGYAKEAQAGLETTWSRQDSAGGIFAGGGRTHWKDTAIAMFTMVRQAELNQDWSSFEGMRPQILSAVRFLAALRDRARSDGSVNGRYGLLPRGHGDGGLSGVRDEFTNTIWAVAGLKAVTDAARTRRLSGFEEAFQLAADLRQALLLAARDQMRRHPAGFDFLPMLAKEDPDWSAADVWKRPRPQTGQWALAQGIYPGLVFDKSDPIVKGYVSLMAACTKEEVPVETGWLAHEGLWTYDAAFAAHAHLWAGLREPALSYFHGFLNHATPLYAWREEQPLRGALVGGCVGDMPHNWASAECVLFLRHILALEDGDTLRLLSGIGPQQLAWGEPFALQRSPTRFGSIDMKLEPGRARGQWRLVFRRDAGPVPAKLTFPASLGALHLARVEGAQSRSRGAVIEVAPEARAWTAVWERGERCSVGLQS